MNRIVYWFSYLYARYIFWSLLDIHSPQPHANGTGRDQDDIVAVTVKFGSCFDDECKNRKDRLMGMFIDNRACAYSKTGG